MKDQDAAAIHAQRIMEATLNDIYKDEDIRKKNESVRILAAIAVVVLVSALTAIAVVAFFKL